MNYDCLICTDKSIKGEIEIGDIKPAVTLVPLPQVLNINGSVVGGVATIPICYSCRKATLKGASRTGLMVP